MEKRLTATKLDMLWRCGVQFSYRYIDGIVAPPGVAMIQGRAVHRSVEQDMLAKRDKGALLQPEELLSHVSDEISTAWSVGPIAFTDDEVERGPSQVRADALRSSIDLALAHHQGLAPVLNPVHVERQFILDTQGMNGWTLGGVIDMQEPDTIRDVKTTSKSPSRDAAETSTQLTLYSMAAGVLDKKPTTKVALDYLVKRAAPVIHTVTAEKTEVDHGMLMRRVARAIQVIEAGAFTPAPPDSWWCTRRFCGYFQRCPYGARRQVQIGPSSD